jgi:type IV pilus assembly protein PilW
MSKKSQARPRRPAARQSGMGLIELMVAILISLLMLLGLFSIVYGTRQNYLAQNQLGQLQDSERLAMTLLTNVVQTGGYFPDPTVSTAATRLPAVTVLGIPFANAGQPIYGVAGDQIYVRYVAGTADGVMDCNGATNTTAAPLSLINTFYVNNSQQLVCQVIANGVAGTVQPLVNGITTMNVLYGVDTNGDGSADEYLAAAAMTAPNWNAVVSVRIQLTFTDPLTGATAPGSGPAVNPQLVRTIDFLNRT